MVEVYSFRSEKYMEGGKENAKLTRSQLRFRASMSDRDYFNDPNNVLQDYEHAGEGDDDDEEDDDQGRLSWTTEKEPIEKVKEDQTNGHHEQGEEVDMENMSGSEEADETFASLEWVTQQIRRLERKQHGVMNGSDDDVDASVREALQLLNGDQDEAIEVKVEETRPNYFDIVQDAMETRWTLPSLEDQEGEDTSEKNVDEETEKMDQELRLESEKIVNHEEWDEEEGKHDDINASGTDNEKDMDEDSGVNCQDDAHPKEVEAEKEDEEEQGEVDNEEEGELDDEEEKVNEKDEWLEAFTAKGRVYYYNRRTRESSWTRPTGSHQTGKLATQQSTTNSDIAKIESKSPSYMTQSSESTSALYCCFCSALLANVDGFRAHMDECDVLHFHKRTCSPLYTQFQAMLCLLSEDKSLRAMHYASSFPDAVSQKPRSEPIQNSLQLLRRSVRTNGSVVTSGHLPSTFDKHPQVEENFHGAVNHRVDRLRQLVGSSDSESLATRYEKMKQKPIASSIQIMETCRHCNRSFAEGRLAKHEAVCPRVFGKAHHAWGRRNSTSESTSHQQLLKRQASLPITRTPPPSASAKVQQHTLALSFKEHQASLVQCPCCHRKFAPSGAMQHIDICKTVQNRPRTIVKDYAIAS